MTEGLHSFFNVFHFGGLWSFSFGFPVDVSCFFHRSGWQPRMIKIFGVGRGKRAEESKDGDSEAVLKNQIPMGPMGCFDGVLDGEFFQAPAAKKKQPGEIRMQKVWVDFMWDWIFGCWSKTTPILAIRSWMKWSCHHSAILSHQPRNTAPDYDSVYTSGVVQRFGRR